MRQSTARPGRPHSHLAAGHGGLSRSGPLLAGLILCGLALGGPVQMLHAEENAIDLASALRLAMIDPKPSADELVALLEQLESSPDNTELRLRLLNYYRPFKNADRSSWESHLVWLLEKHPEEAGTAQVTQSLVALPHEEAMELTKRLWLEQTERYPNDPRVQANAATFFTLHDRELAEALLEKAKALEPENPQWSNQLAQIHELRGQSSSGNDAVSASKAALAELEAALPNLPAEEREATLPRLAKNAFNAGAFAKASKWAQEMLSVATAEPNWNSGNLHHHGHLMLGRLALRMGDLPSAKAHLLDAGRTQGSPQLDSFGPNMSLAKDLLIEGEQKTVLEYLGLCKSFWKLGQERLSTWEKTVRGGGVPDFGANLIY